MEKIMNQSIKPMVPQNQRLMGLKALLEQRKGAIAAVLPTHMTPERLIKISLVAASRSPALLACSPDSIFSSLMDASQLGLEPFTGLNLSYIIPYKNGRTGVSEAKFIPSYRGMLELARRSGQIKSIDSDIIYEHDKWEIEKGLTPKLVHIPNFTCKDRGKALLVYSIAKFKDDGYQFNIMTIDQVEKIRSKSKSAHSGPWVDFWEEMAKKSCLKSLLKLCPMGVELAKAIAKDNAVESGDEHVDIDYIDATAAVESDEISTPSTKAEELIEKLSGPN
jgi:recombination protein RecT